MSEETRRKGKGEKGRKGEREKRRWGDLIFFANRD
jgi:hypothetical protein